MAMATATSTKSPSSNFLYQVLTLPTKNTKLFLPLFTIIALVKFIFILCNFFSVQPLSADIALKAQAPVHTDPTSPDYSLLIAAIQREAKELHLELIIYAVITFLVNSVLTIITFFAITVTCSGELLTLREVLVRTKRNMKGPIITYLFGVFLGLLCNLPLILIALFPLLIKELGSSTLIVLGILALVLFLLAFILLLCLSIFIWPLSMAVSVVETGCYGPSAFKRAAKLAKEKKMKGFLIILASFLLAGALYAINKMILKYSPSSRAASVLVSGLFYGSFGELVAMYISIAVVIYYYECKKSRGGEGEEEEQALKSGDFVYKRVPTKTADHVDGKLP